ncbi:myrosinase 1-like [Adelges cooleyi]|uniref:myrosinase 1-like n=1 Tax=Adelges cooleyi TaxID=133065 RepID=UPI0021800743|nr:myrosinase 1-like [Adelges cooleyi]
MLFVLFLKQTVNREKKMNTVVDFPKDFLFGASSSAYQIEGAVLEDGKGVNIWDVHLHKKQTSNLVCVKRPKDLPDKHKGNAKFVGISKMNHIFMISGDNLTNPTSNADVANANVANADVACDSYHKTDEDIALLKELSVQVYRFSVSWSRVLPTGYDHEPNDIAIKHYQDFIDKLLANNIQPMVTMYHFDLPQRLQDVGGWANNYILGCFASYARFLYKTFGDKVKLWTTINEPRMVSEGYGGFYGCAPNLGEKFGGIGDYLAIRNMMLAHATAYRIYENEFKSTQNGEVTICFDVTWGFPRNEKDENDLKASELVLQHNVGIFIEPLVSGNFPKIVVDCVEDTNKRKGINTRRIIPFTEEEKKVLIGSYDFMSFNYYTAMRVSLMSEEELEKETDLKVIDKKVNSGDWKAPHEPEDNYNGFTNILKWLSEKCKKDTKFFICENGVADEKEKSPEENTKNKIEYHRGILVELSKALKNDINVFGYCVWSLMDSFEWGNGYNDRYGIYEVDFDKSDRPRSKKGCFDFFNKLFQEKKLLPLTSS